MKTIYLRAAFTGAILAVLANIASGETCEGDNLSIPDAAALVEMQSLADAGNAQAQTQVGAAYLFGKGSLQDIGKALFWLKKSAAKGSSVGQYLLGRYYVLHGKSEDDFRAAASWLKKSADQGCVQSLAYLGVLSLSGKGVEKNAEEGFRLASKAAEAGYVFAQVMVGLSLITGEGVSKDAKAGFNWIKRAAETGDSAAAILLATLYLEGTGTAKTPEKTHAILETVFKKGDDQASTAAYYLGWMYMEGEGVPMDKVKSFRWMVIAANAGVSDSQSRLKTLTDQLPKQKLLTSCSVYVNPHYRASSATEYLHADVGETVAVLSSDKNNTEVFFPDRTLLGWISQKCLNQ